jgi:predicted nucleotidyltransferase
VPLSAEDIQRAFGALSEELERQNQHAEMVVAGGAALVLLFGARTSTKDVDAVFLTPEASVVRKAVAVVAERLELPDDWLNDGAKGYFVTVSMGEALYTSRSLSVRAASLDQLLAMKLAAWRDAVDRADARLLLQHMSGSKDEIWTRISPFVPAHDTDKSSYAFDDLWDAAE